jgi:hypothetical protein
MLLKDLFVLMELDVYLMGNVIRILIVVFLMIFVGGEYVIPPINAR